MLLQMIEKEGGLVGGHPPTLLLISPFLERMLSDGTEGATD